MLNTADVLLLVGVVMVVAQVVFGIDMFAVMLSPLVFCCICDCFKILHSSNIFQHALYVSENCA